ncbi:hypothetical protein [Cellulomonas phragmiteti]|uniref:DUF5648 domain-containing protein n=1 Tax=Cellulomonas phragmiteti TaxID=478780 RepID=A0ABQ4DJU0_9CELL|nr:hypothetical protein [Cellulomonas phragmiteti]GIG39624.1 hypothetical protein Cph01nite_13860 [Cellulomonas phragmiteti]
MRSRTLTRPALVLALALGLGGALGGTAVAAEAPTLQKITTEVGASGATAKSATEAPLAAAAEPKAAMAGDLGYGDAEWTAFRSLNLARLGQGYAPVIRNGGLNAVATSWLSGQTSTYDPQLDGDLEWKVPAGSYGGVQLMYWWAGTDMNVFLELLAEELEYDGVDPFLTDSGISIAQSSYGIFAYIVVLEYPHSTAGAGELPLYRFYKPSAGTHFYSTSAAERNNVIGMAEYRYEGLIAYIRGPQEAPGSTTLRNLNRFYLPSAGTHFYTSSPDEYAAVLTYPQYSLDGVAGRVSAVPGSGLTAMHRFFVPKSGTHFYTANAGEVETVKGIPGYTYEGVAYYLRVAG